MSFSRFVVIRPLLVETPQTGDSLHCAAKKFSCFQWGEHVGF